MFSAQMIPEAVQKVFNSPALVAQTWVRYDDGQTYNGAEMACRWWERGLFKTSDEAIGYFSKSKVGDCFRTGVSAYERIDPLAVRAAEMAATPEADQAG